MLISLYQRLESVGRVQASYVKHPKFTGTRVYVLKTQMKKGILTGGKGKIRMRWKKKKRRKMKEEGRRG